MSDSTGNSPYGGQPSDPDRPSQQQPPAYPPPQQSPYGQTPAAPDSTQGNASGQGSGADQPFGQPPQAAPYGQGYGQPQYGQAQYGQPQYGGYQPAGDPDKRPGTVTAAGVLTILLSGMIVIGCLFGAAGLAIARDDIVDAIRDDPQFDQQLSGIDPGSIVTVGIVVLALFLLWAVLAIVLAIFAMRRSNGARIALVVSSALAAVMSLLAIGAVFPALWLIGSIVVVVCLFTGGAGAWYSRSGAVPTGRSGMSPPVA